MPLPSHFSLLLPKAIIPTSCGNSRRKSTLHEDLPGYIPIPKDLSRYQQAKPQVRCRLRAFYRPSFHIDICLRAFGISLSFRPNITPWWHADPNRFIMPTTASPITSGVLKSCIFTDQHTQGKINQPAYRKSYPKALTVCTPNDNCEHDGRAGMRTALMALIANGRVDAGMWLQFLRESVQCSHLCQVIFVTISAAWSQHIFESQYLNTQRKACNRAETCNRYTPACLPHHTITADEARQAVDHQYNNITVRKSQDSADNVHTVMRTSQSHLMISITGHTRPIAGRVKSCILSGYPFGDVPQSGTLVGGLHELHWVHGRGHQGPALVVLFLFPLFSFWGNITSISEGSCKVGRRKQASVGSCGSGFAAMRGYLKDVVPFRKGLNMDE